MMNPTEAYKYDNTFRSVVDQMRSVLSIYHITPAELRQAAILAATMHDAEHIKPIIFTASGRIQTPKPNFTVQDKHGPKPDTVTGFMPDSRYTDRNDF